MREQREQRSSEKRENEYESKIVRAIRQLLGCQYHVGSSQAKKLDLREQEKKGDWN